MLISVTLLDQNPDRLVYRSPSILRLVKFDLVPWVESIPMGCMRIQHQDHPPIGLGMKHIQLELAFHKIKCIQLDTTHVAWVHILCPTPMSDADTFLNTSRTLFKLILNHIQIFFLFRMFIKHFLETCFTFVL